MSASMVALTFRRPYAQLGGGGGRGGGGVGGGGGDEGWVQKPTISEKQIFKRPLICLVDKT